jgi:transcription antitermination factor NusG
LRVRSRAEKAVARYLGYQGVESFLPRYTDKSYWSDRTKQVERLLFPGYIFVRCVEVASVLEVAGVVGVLGGNLTPAVIPESEIDSVRLVIASMRPLLPADFTPGEKVTITRGSLKGASGVVERAKNALRLVVNVEMLGRGVAVEISAECLSKITPRTTATERPVRSTTNAA